MKNNGVMGRLHQQGMTTLTISLIVLFLMSLIILFTSSNALFELKIGNNQYYQAKAQESARGGIAYATAWLVNGSNMSSIVWSDDATGPSGNNQRATAATFPAVVSTQSIGGNTVTVSLWRNSVAPTILELMATVSGDGSSTVRQKILFNSISTPNTINLGTYAPIVINGGLSGVTGNPSINPGTSGTAIATSTTQANSSLIDTGHLSLGGGSINYGAFSGTAWSFLFPNTTQAQMKAAADYVTIFYYDDAAGASNISNFSSLKTNKKVIGSSANPVILIFDSSITCVKINGGLTIYGVVYYSPNELAVCKGTNGWGGGTIYGSLVADSSITKLTANTNFDSWTVNTTPGVINLPPTVTKTIAKHSASWRDF